MIYLFYKRKEVNMSVYSLVNELKENNEDLEFYPTTDEMLSVIAPYMDNETVLDIGCGLCHFKKYMDKKSIELAAIKTNQEKIEAEKKGKNWYKTYHHTDNEICKIDKYYVIEKSKILLSKLDEEAICVGTDLYESTLIDKKVTTIFCNPPYSDYISWTKKILNEGNFKQAFLIIPDRWADNTEIQSILKAYNTSYDILGTFSFANAERPARANVNVVRFRRNKYINRYKNQEDFDKDVFDVFFEQMFAEELKHAKQETFSEKEREKAITNALQVSKGKASTLVELYQQDYNHLLTSLSAIMKLDASIMATFNLDTEKIKAALIEKMKGLKIIYWDRVWEMFEEITSRLTASMRNKLKNKYSDLYMMDFTVLNIWAMILYVSKRANKYFDTQLIDFYQSISDEANVKPYKSNKKLFEKDGWYWNAKEHSHYVLDYRIIMSSPFRTSWHGEFQVGYDSDKTLKDIKTIAKNLGFNVSNFNLPSEFGEKAYMYYINTKGEEVVFMEYKAYKNGNMHVKFNQEFTKALNVEVARLLGWLRCKEDIAREFPEEFRNGAEKYFKSNYDCLSTNSNILALVDNLK